MSIVLDKEGGFALWYRLAEFDMGHLALIILADFALEVAAFGRKGGGIEGEQISLMSSWIATLPVNVGLPTRVSNSML